MCRILRTDFIAPRRSNSPTIDISLKKISIVFVSLMAYFSFLVFDPIGETDYFQEIKINSKE